MKGFVHQLVTFSNLFSNCKAVTHCPPLTAGETAEGGYKDPFKVRSIIPGAPGGGGDIREFPSPPHAPLGGELPPSDPAAGPAAPAWVAEAAAEQTGLGMRLEGVTNRCTTSHM